jgi:polyisoprenoid-binding protein YceI
MRFLRLLLFAAAWAGAADGQPVYRCNDGTVRFSSDAPLEIIEASSDEMTGLIDAGKKTFVFLVEIRSFDGFNAALQRDHFNENYMESSKFPHGTFKGKIIEDVDFSVPGVYAVRAKGVLNLHGVEQERIIKGELTVRPGGATVKAVFTVRLADHGIRIPKVVNEKIASEIEITVEGILKPQ